MESPGEGKELIKDSGTQKDGYMESSGEEKNQTLAERPVPCVAK